MKWRKKASNIIIASILSIAYIVVTLLNIIGPLHINQTGNINPLGALSYYSVVYLIFSLALTWGLYYSLRKKPELLFFILIIVGIALIIFANFLWGWIGS